MLLLGSARKERRRWHQESGHLFTRGTSNTWETSVSEGAEEEPPVLLTRGWQWGCSGCNPVSRQHSP